MVDDSAELERELAFTPRKTLFGRTERPPPGSHVVTAIGIVYTGLLWIASIGLMSVLGAEARSSSDVVSPGACFALIVLGGEMFLAGILAGWTWRALGPTLRTVLRPFGLLGPWPILIVAVLAFAYVAGVASGKFRVDGTPILPSGDNWQVAALQGDPKHGVWWSKAEPACAALGPGWRIPTGDEWASLRPPPRAEAGQFFWVASSLDPAQGETVRAQCDASNRCAFAPPAPASDPHAVARVLCFKP